jgi:hypothetical protein
MAPKPESFTSLTPPMAVGPPMLQSWGPVMVLMTSGVLGRGISMELL